MPAHATHLQTRASTRAVGSVDSRVLSSVLQLFGLVVGTMGGDSATAAMTNASPPPPAAALTAFGIKLLNEMTPDDEAVGNNVFISPW